MKILSVEVDRPLVVKIVTSACSAVLMAAATFVLGAVHVQRPGDVRGDGG